MFTPCVHVLSVLGENLIELKESHVTFVLFKKLLLLSFLFMNVVRLKYTQHLATRILIGKKHPKSKLQRLRKYKYGQNLQSLSSY